MEQNLVSDELIKRINDVLNDSKERSVDETLDYSSAEKFHDVYDDRDIQDSELGLGRRKIISLGGKRNLELENHILASQLEAERKKSRELQGKFQLFEDSVKYFERLNGQLETIRRTVEEESLVLNDQGDYGKKGIGEAMQKLRPKTVHTAVNMGSPTSGHEDADDGAAISSEPQTEDGKESKSFIKSRRQQDQQSKDEIAFRDAEDFKQLEQDLEIMKDKEGGSDIDVEKVFITKTEKKCLEDIGNIASRMRTPLDDKHQRFFEKDRRKFPNRIVMPETQEVDKLESVPPDLVTKTKETPVNITSTELDGLRSYLLQLKELIARRETAWARTTERDYNQRVEITRFKNEVNHLRMLCEKRQKDIKERDQVIEAKDEEIKELQKKVQALRNSLLKLEKKDVNEALEGLTNEVLENSQLVQRSYNVMKRTTLLNKSGVAGQKSTTSSIRRAPSGKDIRAGRTKPAAAMRKIKSTSSNSNDEDSKGSHTKTKVKSEKLVKVKHRSESESRTQTKSSIERVDEKLQRIEEMLHSDVLKGVKKPGWKPTCKAFPLKGLGDLDPSFQRKGTPTNSKMRQEMMVGAITNLSGNANLGSKAAPFPEAKKQQGNAALLANALLAARNTNVFNL